MANGNSGACARRCRPSWRSNGRGRRRNATEPGELTGAQRRGTPGLACPTQEGITDHWESESGPITLNFELGGQPASVSPGYREDWIDLEVLHQINQLIGSSGRQFQCAVDGNLALVLCLTPDQKRTMQAQRRFLFAW
jgi:hypothetical protein